MSEPAAAARPASRFDGIDAAEIARRVGAPVVDLHDEVDSTQDLAHALAANGALPGTVVLAEVQRQGRGRQGATWHSERGRGLWFTVIERPADAAALEVLSLRIGLQLAAALDALAEMDAAPIALKWPNDLYREGRKVGGILLEARWRDGRPDWLAVGVGLNLSAPEGHPEAGGLGETSRIRVLAATVPAVRRAAEMSGVLTPVELAAFARRDLAAGRRCTQPASGVVEGIAADGSLLVRTDEGQVAVRAGSLVFAED